MKKSNGPLMTGGLVLVLAAAGLLLALVGRGKIVTGIVWGIFVAYAGTILYFFLIPRPAESGPFRFVQGYLPGAVIRYIVMIGLFCGVVFWLRVNPAGVLIGTFVGMMASTFVSLNSMRQPPEA